MAPRRIATANIEASTIHSTSPWITANPNDMPRPAASLLRAVNMLAMKGP